MLELHCVEVSVGGATLQFGDPDHIQTVCNQLFGTKQWLMPLFAQEFTLRGGIRHNFIHPSSY